MKKWLSDPMLGYLQTVVKHIYSTEMERQHTGMNRAKKMNNLHKKNHDSSQINLHRLPY